MPEGDEEAMLVTAMARNSPMAMDIYGFFLSEIGLGHSARLYYFACVSQYIDVKAINRDLPGRQGESQFEGLLSQTGTRNTGLSIEWGGLIGFGRLQGRRGRGRGFFGGGPRPLPNGTTSRFPLWEARGMSQNEEYGPLARVFLIYGRHLQFIKDKSWKMPPKGMLSLSGTRAIYPPPVRH